MDDTIAKVITEQGVEGLGRFYSTYRGYVTKNDDPLGMNRVKVCVPEVRGIILWALPKGQQGSFNSGIKWLTPKIGDTVWVSFEGGDISKPIWEYYGWASGETPIELDDKDVIGFKSPNGNTIILDETDGHLDVYIQGDITIHSPGIVDISSNTQVRVNSGNNYGVINIKELTDKLNKLVEELESLKSSYNAHVHTIPIGTTGPMNTPYNNSFSKFNKNDYEDTKFTH